MAVTLPSDLVLDVAQAVDPVQYRTSVQKLGRMPASAEVVDGRGHMPFAGLAGVHTPSAATSAMADIAGNKRVGEAYQKFEAFMLQIFIQEMFTTDTPSVFGKGPGGDYWKSMMAEMIGGEMARGGGIGVASMLENHRKSQGEKTQVPLQTMAGALVQAGQTEMVRTYFAKSS